MRPKAPPFSDFDPTYYDEDIGFEITPTHKLAQDKPTVTIKIPCDRLICEMKGATPMKRLKYYLQQMQNDTTTYKEMYEGITEAIFPCTSWNGHVQDPETRQDPVYWHGDYSVEITQTHKLAQDRPTLL